MTMKSQDMHLQVFYRLTIEYVLGKTIVLMTKNCYVPLKNQINLVDYRY